MRLSRLTVASLAILLLGSPVWGAPKAKAPKPASHPAARKASVPAGNPHMNKHSHPVGPPDTRKHHKWWPIT